MNIFAVIAEFNPLHQGHAFLLQEARKQSGADYCIILMSGSYVQRGEPAFLDKNLRTEAALRCGADLVLELPVPFATGSAEYFASASVSLLDRLGCVTHLAFGSETGDLNLLIKGAALLETEEPLFQTLLQQHLKSGSSYPAALETASRLSGVSSELSSVLRSPNNILGLEYLKALRRLNSAIRPLTIMRRGSGYHDQNLPDYGVFASAEAIRLAVRQKEAMEKILLTVPPQAAPLVQNAVLSGSFVTPDMISLPLFQVLIHSDASALQQYQDVSADLADKIIKYRDRFFLVEDLIRALKSKDLTYSRISRSLLHILLGITREEVQQRKCEGFASYAKVLGFRKEAGPLLHQIKAHSSIPMITKYSDAGRFLDPAQQHWHEKDLRADAFYQTLTASHRYYSAVPSSDTTPHVTDSYVRNVYRSSAVII